MAPNAAAIAGTLRQIIYYHLDNSAHDNALFFAERLAAQDPRASESAHLLALCHLRRGDARSAFETAKPMGSRGINLGCVWVYAQAALTLEKHADGIAALEKARSLWGHKATLGRTTATARATYPDAAAVLCLLGRLNRSLGDSKKAIGHFEESLRLNPFMWDAFTALCDMGVSIRVPNIFKSTEPLVHAFDQEAAALMEQKENMCCEVPKKNSIAASSSARAVSSVSATVSTISASSDQFVDAQSTFSTQPNNNNTMDLDADQNVSRSRHAATLADSSTSRGGGGGNGFLEPQAPLAAPSRKTRPVPEGDAPRSIYRLEKKRNTRATAAEKEQHSSAEVAPPDSSGAATSPPPSTRNTTAATASSTSLLLQGLRSGIPATGKRTASGHPVGPQEAAGEQRRSARLRVFKSSSSSSSSRSNTFTTASAAMAPTAASASRELKKKTRPQISRMMRPATSSVVGRVVSGNRKPLEDATDVVVDQGDGGSRTKDSSSSTTTTLHPPAAAATALMRQAEAETAKVEEALKWILDLVRRLASGYYSLSQFQCADAIATLSQLSHPQLDTAWVQAQMGRAHYEQAAYADAEKHYARMRQLAPTRLDDLEIYSTVLWHLKRETQLSYLAYELTDMAWYAPQTWCVVGNSCSLSRDPEHALRCFRRATSIDPKFAYAYTLQGHEHVANEEYEKALAAYRQAIAADNRHYNAYYGIGRVHDRLGNYASAHAHFGAASVINPTNPVLLVWIGTVLQAQNQLGPALHYFTRAVALAPNAAQTRYKLARLLLAVGMTDLAHAELMKLKDLAPDEALVHFLLGKLYRGMDERQLAVRHFSNALALDPKAAPQIKLAIETMEDGGMDDSIMG